MFGLTIKTLLAHKRRLAGTALAVILGVAFLCGTIILGDTMGKGFDAAFASFNAGTDVIVRSAGVVGTDDSEQRERLPSSLLATIAQVDGVARVEPQLQGVAQIVGVDGEPIGGDGPPTLGSNWITGSLNPFQIEDGRAPTSPGEVAIDRGSAEIGKLRVGSTTTVLTPAPVEVTVVGLAAAGDNASIGGATLTFFSTEEARRVLVGGADESTTIVVSAEPGTSAEALSRRVASVLPESTEALTSAQLTAEQVDAIGADFLNFLRGFLVVFSGVAMLVATFSIHNTFSVLLAQRTRESALLRAIGATRGQVIGSMAGETAFIGVVASLLGAAAGVGLAAGLLWILEAFGLDLPTNGLAVSWSSLAISGGVGFVATMVAGVVPAIVASRVPPIAAMRSTAVEAVRVNRYRIATGAILIAGGLTLLIGPAIELWTGSVPSVAAGATALFIGMIVIGPGVARPVTAVIGAPLKRWRGISGDLARQNAMRSPRRTASTAAALMVGVGVVTLFTVFGASLVASIDDTVAGSLRADFVVESAGFSGAGLDPGLPTKLASLDEVSASVAFERGAVRLDRNSTDVTITDPTRLSDVVDPAVTSGSLDAVTGDRLAVSDTLAEERGWNVGSQVDAVYGDGATSTLEIAAIYSSAEILGDAVLPTETWAPHAAQSSIRTILLTTAPNVDPVAARTAIDDAGQALATPNARDRQEYVDELSGEIGDFLSTVYVLLALSVIIALMGIANTISLSIHERTREIGLLRAVGQTRDQTRAMVRWEAAVISVFGTIGGVGVGLLAAWGLVGALGESEGIGVFDAPVTRLVIIVAVGAVVGVIAGIRPARRAARLDPLRAIAG